MSITSCQQCRSKERQLKILQADLEFQIKRTREDLAEEKVMLELNFQKQYKKTMEKYNKEKQEREEQNRKWIAKYDNMVFQFEQRIQTLNQHFHQEYQKLKDEMGRDHTLRESQKFTKYQQQIDTLKKDHSRQLIDIKKSQRLELTQLKEDNQQTVTAIRTTNLQKINEITSEYESNVKHLRKEIEEMHQNCDNLKKEAHQKQTALYQQIYARKHEISTLKYQIDQLNVNIKNCEEQIRFKNLEIEVLKQKHQQSLENIKKQLECEKGKIIDDFNKQIQGLLLQKLQDCQQFQQNVKHIQQKRQTSMKIYETCLNEVKELIQIRPSRQEDVEQISVLKDLLNQKQAQFQKVVDEAKTYKLELNYKEQTFKRIFTHNTNPLNIEQISGKRKDHKFSRGNSVIRQSNKYNSVAPVPPLTINDFRKQKLALPKSTKLF